MSSEVFDIAFRKQIGECLIHCTVATDTRLVALTGPSGIGKTSALNCIAGLLRPDAGHIAIGGKRLFDAARDLDLAPHLRGCGYLFQDSRLFPHLSVEKNLRFAQRADDSAVPFSIASVAAMLDITALLNRMPRHLSGGETRRVALARTLVSGADFLLLDEPLASLDPARGDAVLRALEMVLGEAHMPVLYVTHDPSELARFDPHVVEMKEVRHPLVGGQM